MSQNKPFPSPKSSTRERVLDAAEQLLARNGAAFSMRDLADEAGVSFATPFNQFGNKAAIMLALSARRIALMQVRLDQAKMQGTACRRIFAAIDIATAVMLEAPVVNKLLMGAISTPGEESGDVSIHSGALWEKALGDGEGLIASSRPLALTVIPPQLALAFRGALSFWAAGEISDAGLHRAARSAAAAVLLGFASREDRMRLLQFLESGEGI